MIEVLWHGRGGQGAFTAARLLGAASSFADGSYALAFPSFGPERRGAPMRAFTKMSREPIGDRSAVSRANYVIYLDDTLLGEGWEDELLPDGKVIVNSVRSFGDPRIVAIDANGISQEILGRPIPNTALLGALCSVCDYVSADDVKRAIEGYMPAKLHEKNKCVVDAALEAVGKTRAAGVVVKIDESPESQVSDSVSRETVEGGLLLRPLPAARRSFPRCKPTRSIPPTSPIRHATTVVTSWRRTQAGAICVRCSMLGNARAVCSATCTVPMAASSVLRGRRPMRRRGSCGHRLRFLQGVRRVRRGVSLRRAFHGPRKRG